MNPLDQEYLLKEIIRRDGSLGVLSKKISDSSDQLDLVEVFVVLLCMTKSPDNTNFSNIFEKLIMLGKLEYPDISGLVEDIHNNAAAQKEKAEFEENQRQRYIKAILPKLNKTPNLKDRVIRVFESLLSDGIEEFSTDQAHIITLLRLRFNLYTTDHGFLIPKYKFENSQLAREILDDLKTGIVQI